jgi:hypothetical protein
LSSGSIPIVSRASSKLDAQVIEFVTHRRICSLCDRLRISRVVRAIPVQHFKEELSAQLSRFSVRA